jgi:glycerol-3-phosphate dehydrogenase
VPTATAPTWCSPGIRSTGVSSSPALAELVHDIPGRAGALVLDERAGAENALEPAPRLLGHPNPATLFARDAAYGEVVCPCEQVTAAEIEAACRMRLPPRSVDGLRKRTHATAGRCQGATCLADLTQRLAARV